LGYSPSYVVVVVVSVGADGRCVLQAKDCIHLLHLYLTKRELESRRVKNRSFEGVDVRELDLIDPQAHV
jgi:hypothetical protein